jgi:hypothetical protein
VAGIKHGKGTSKLKKINIMRGNYIEMYPTLYFFTFFFIRTTKYGSKMEILEEIYAH